MLNDGEAEDDVIGISSRLLGFLLLGITLVFVGIAVLIVASAVLGGSGSVGGVILIGPIPIVFGAGTDAGWLIAISIILSVVSVVLFLVMNRRARRFSG
ncbi:MAG: DUF131 domain-containing protein [Candidatus Bathyarchaeota archaeon]|nr:DUF131 domain-containing protein [Candidatus Bathyarchaeota archaeon]